MVRLNDQALLALIKNRVITTRLRNEEYVPMIFCDLVQHTIHFGEDCEICETKCWRYQPRKDYYEKYERNRK